MRWENDIYREKFGFRIRQGLELAAQLTPVRGKLLEIGSETGILSYQLWKLGYTVEGIEFDYKLVDLARRTTAKSVFYEGDAEDLLLYEDNYMMAIAGDALNKVPREHQPALLENVYRSLKPGAEMTFDLGGAGNEQIIEETLAQSFAEEGAEYTPRYCPEAAEYEALLTSAGFRVDRIAALQRDQTVPGEDGMEWYLRMIYRGAFPRKQEELAERIIAKSCAALRGALFDGSAWTLPQVRLMGKVTKQGG